MAENNGQISEYQEGAGGKFRAGNPGKPYGAVTKVSVKAKESIIKFVENNIDEIQTSFDELEPKEKLDFISSILSYVVPKLSATQIDASLQVNQWNLTMNLNAGNKIHKTLDSALPSENN